MTTWLAWAATSLSSSHPTCHRRQFERKLALLSALAQQASRQICGKDILSLSVGAAFYPQDGADAEKLLAEADKRMYAAKQFHHEHAEMVSTPLDQHSRAVSVN